MWKFELLRSTLRCGATQVGGEPRQMKAKEIARSVSQRIDAFGQGSKVISSQGASEKARARLDVLCGCTLFHNILSFDTYELGASPVAGFAGSRVTCLLSLLGEKTFFVPSSRCCCVVLSRFNFIHCFGLFSHISSLRDICRWTLFHPEIFKTRGGIYQVGP